jgi:hypothetical protein
VREVTKDDCFVDPGLLGDLPRGCGFETLARKQFRGDPNDLFSTLCPGDALGLRSHCE